MVEYGIHSLLQPVEYILWEGVYRIIEGKMLEQA